MHRVRSVKFGRVNYKRVNEIVTNKLQNTFCLSTYKRLLQDVPAVSCSHPQGADDAKAVSETRV